MRLLIFILLALSATLYGQIPPGGTVLNATSGTTFQRIGKGTLTQVDISGQSFSTALRYTTGNDIANAWDAQIRFPAAAGIAVNDVILVSFWARTISSIDETGQGALMVCIEQNTSPHTKQLYYRINLGSEWRQYFASAKSTAALSSSAVSYSFHTGYISQTIEVADVRFINYKNTLGLNDLPVTAITYGGSDSDAPWRAAAAARIEKYRKGTADIMVYDEEGNLLKDALITIEMTRHEFGFGTAVDANVFLNNATYRNKVYELFNEAVFENDLKWSSFNPSAANAHIRRVLDSLDNRKIAVRGHTVVWPSFRYNPSSVKNLENDPVALRNAIDQRIDQVTQFTKGRLIDWDVLNEPYTERDFQNILGDEVMADWFKRVRNNDRTVKMYINDFGILSGGGSNTAKQNGYAGIIRFIEEKGGKIDGIGLQGHFASDLTSIPKIYSILDMYAAMGKEIKITEHDISITQRDVQADYTRDLLTIVFSHPSVRSFLVWGFWAGRHWRPDAAFYATNWSIHPHGEVWKDLIYNQWWTPKATMTTDASGKVGLEGFLGTYRYTIEANGKKRSGTMRLVHPNASGIKGKVVLSLDTSIPDVVEISSSQPASLCEGESITLRVPEGEGLSYSWYRNSEPVGNQSSTLTATEAGVYVAKIKKGNIEVQSPDFKLYVHPVPESVIDVTGALSFCQGAAVTLSTVTSPENTYSWLRGNTKIHGSVPSLSVKESGTYRLITQSNGCSAVSEPVTVEVWPTGDSRCTTGIDDVRAGVRVYPNPFRDKFIVEVPGKSGSKISLELYNAAGILVHKTVPGGATERTEISSVSPGIYTLKVMNVNEIKSFKLVSLQ